MAPTGFSPICHRQVGPLISIPVISREFSSSLCGEAESNPDVTLRAQLREEKGARESESLFFWLSSRRVLASRRVNPMSRTVSGQGLWRANRPYPDATEGPIRME
jgi:hypothetical protein